MPCHVVLNITEHQTQSRRQPPLLQAAQFIHHPLSFPLTPLLSRSFSLYLSLIVFDATHTETHKHTDYMHWCVNELPDNIWLLHVREKLINLSSTDELMNSEYKGQEERGPDAKQIAYVRNRNY